MSKMFPLRTKQKHRHKSFIIKLFSRHFEFPIRLPWIDTHVCLGAIAQRTEEIHVFMSLINQQFVMTNAHKVCLHVNTTKKTTTATHLYAEVIGCSRDETRKLSKNVYFEAKLTWSSVEQSPDTSRWFIVTSCAVHIWLNLFTYSPKCCPCGCCVWT